MIFAVKMIINNLKSIKDMRVINTVKSLLTTLIIGLASCNQVTVPDAERPSGLGSTEKVKQDFVIENPSSIGLPSLGDNESLSVFSLLSPEENCKFTYSNTFLSGEAPQGGKLIALYPYSETATMVVEGGQVILSTTVPSEQDFIETSIPDANPEVSGLSETNALSDIAVGVNSGEGFSFKSIYGRIILPIKSTGQDVTVKSIKLEGLSGEKISGDIKVSVSEEGILSVISASNTSVVYNGDITVSKDNTKYVVFNVIPQNFSKGLKLTLTKSDNIAVEQEYESVSVKVNKESILDEFVFEAPIKDYYIEYTADQQVVIEGYDCEEYNSETKTGRIYLSTSEVPAKLLNGKDVINSVKISAKVTSIGTDAFRGMKTKLTSVSVEENSELTTIGQMAFQACQVCVFDFSNATKLEHIGNTAFGECYKMMSYDFPESVRTIELGAFRNLRWTDVRVKEGVTTLGTVNGGQGFLQGCKQITRLELPSTLSKVEKNGLKMEHNVDGPTYILICKAEVPPTINTQGSFLSQNNKAKLTAIYVPDGSVESYKSANGWKNWNDRIKSLSELIE